MKDVVKNYTLRWKIEEVFRVLKVCIGLNRCQQHTLIAQKIYIFMSLVLFACAERIKDGSIYKLLNLGYFQKLDIENLLYHGLMPIV